MTPRVAVFVDGVGKLSCRTIHGEPPPHAMRLVMQFGEAAFRKLIELPDGRLLYAFTFPANNYQVWMFEDYITAELRADPRALAGQRQDLARRLLALEAEGLSKAITAFDVTTPVDSAQALERRVVIGVCRKADV